MKITDVILRNCKIPFFFLKVVEDFTQLILYLGHGKKNLIPMVLCTPKFGCQKIPEQTKIIQGFRHSVVQINYVNIKGMSRLILICRLPSNRQDEWKINKCPFSLSDKGEDFTDSDKFVLIIAGNV